MDLSLFVLLAASGLVCTLVWAEQSHLEALALSAATLLATAAGFWSSRFNPRYADTAQAFVALAAAAVGMAALRLARDGLAAACADPYQLVCADSSAHLATVAPIYLAAALLAGITAAFAYAALASHQPGE